MSDQSSNTSAFVQDGRIIIQHSECYETLPSLDDIPLRKGWVYIYALADPANGQIRYIGKSIRPLERLTNHCNEKSVCHRTNWIKAMIREGRRPVIGILDRLDESEDWKTAEQRWIKYGRECGWNLVNETDGGDGVRNLSAEARAKLSLRFKGKPLSEEHRKKVGRKGRRHSSETKARMSRIHKGRVFTPEWKTKISRAMTGNGKNRKRKLTLAQANEIIRKVTEGETRESIAKEYGINKRTVWLVSSGRWCPTTLGKKEDGDASQ